MSSVTVPTDKLNKVLVDVEVLLEDVASLVNQDEIVRQRLSEVKENPSIEKSEEELNSYLDKRGVEIE